MYLHYVPNFIFGLKLVKYDRKQLTRQIQFILSGFQINLFKFLKHLLLIIFRIVQSFIRVLLENGFKNSLISILS